MNARIDLFLILYFADFTFPAPKEKTKCGGLSKIWPMRGMGAIFFAPFSPPCGPPGKPA
ncbi:MAG TPA: hypothetical protein VF194_12320 [Ferrovibrio sp.]|uniref:hypothetical protein n=1 Tax=Ferrovibrio sp. TaxID=1917215 RepID=UPI002ED4481F